jgi:hypothetical protein
VPAAAAAAAAAAAGEVLVNISGGINAAQHKLLVRVLQQASWDALLYASKCYS